MKYTVIEETHNYIICHGSKLSFEDATRRVFRLIELEQNDGSTLQDAEFAPELECNETGFCISGTYKGKNICTEGIKTTYYVLEDDRDND